MGCGLAVRKGAVILYCKLRLVLRKFEGGCVSLGMGV